MDIILELQFYVKPQSQNFLTDKTTRLVNIQIVCRDPLRAVADNALQCLTCRKYLPYHWLILLKTIISCEGPHIFCIRSLRFTMTKQKEMVTLSISFTVLSKLISLIQLQVTSFILSCSYMYGCSRIYSDIHSYNLLYKYIPIFVLINLRWHISYMVALEYIQIWIRIISFTTIFR